MSGNTEIKPGDVVVLKSGGPSMTVRRVGVEGDYMSGGDIGELLCEWFDQKTYATKWFTPTSLKKVDQQ